MFTANLATLVTQEDRGGGGGGGGGGAVYTVVRHGQTNLTAPSTQQNIDGHFRSGRIAHFHTEFPLVPYAHAVHMALEQI